MEAKNQCSTYNTALFTADLSKTALSKQEKSQNELEGKNKCFTLYNGTVHNCRDLSTNTTDKTCV